MSETPAPVDRDDLPDYYGPYPNVVREHDGRNVVVGVGRETNQHGIQAGARVVVSCSARSGRGTVKRVAGGAPIDGGAILMVDMDDGDGWEHIPASWTMLEEGV